jgi:hypothetical protein
MYLTMSASPIIRCYCWTGAFSPLRPDWFHDKHDPIEMGSDSVQGLDLDPTYVLVPAL